MREDVLVRLAWTLPRRIAGRITFGQSQREELELDGFEALVKLARAYPTDLLDDDFRSWVACRLRCDMLDALRTRTHARSRYQISEVPLKDHDFSGDSLSAPDQTDTTDLINSQRLLTASEKRTCSELAAGMTKTEIAEKWNVTQGAVSHQVKKIAKNWRAA